MDEVQHNRRDPDSTELNFVVRRFPKFQWQTFKKARIGKKKGITFIRDGQLPSCEVQTESSMGAKIAGVRKQCLSLSLTSVEGFLGEIPDMNY